jgi:hypothetical protein
MTLSFVKNDGLDGAGNRFPQLALAADVLQ